MFTFYATGGIIMIYMEGKIMYDKEYFAEQLKNILEPIERFYNGSKVQFAQHSAWYENASADMEAFARPLWGLVPLWAGGKNAESFEKLYLSGLADGTDSDSEGYWGECHERDQRFVEMASIAYGLIFAKDKLWEPLADRAKDNLEKWLGSINAHDVCDSNWIFFRVLVNVAMKKVGRKYDAVRLEKDLARLDEFYIGNGWYKDGIHGQTDYYIAFAFHFYGLVYAVAMENEDSERARKYKERASEFAKTFIYWFDEDGEALPYGRSLTYRFAQTAFWSACVTAGIRPFPIEVMKGIIVRNLENWLSKDIFDHACILTVGYDYPNLLMAEHYNAHGSPYWGLKAYMFLMLPDNHEFWKCEAAPMPSLNGKKLIKEAQMLVSRRNGRSVAYVGGNNTYFDCGQIIPKYLKFAYSAHFGFNVMRSNISLAETAPDSMLVFMVDGIVMVRRHFTSCAVNEDKVVIEWSPFKGIEVKTTVTPTDYGHMREHEITSDIECEAYDAGFAVANRDSDNCVSGGGETAFARNSFQQCEVLSESGGEGIVIPASPNTNLRYQKTLIPAMKYEIRQGKNIIRTIVKDGGLV